MRVLFCFILFATSTTASAQSLKEPLCFSCYTFIAPSVSDATTVVSPEVGLIVYDTDFEMFRGFDQNGDWLKLSNEKSVITVSASGSISALADVILANAGGITLTLPPAADTKGKELTIKKITSDSGYVRIDGNSAETIDGMAEFDIATQHGYVQLISDGTNYQIVTFRDPWKVLATLNEVNVLLSTSDVVYPTNPYKDLSASGLIFTAKSGSLPVGAACPGSSSVGSATCSGSINSVGVTFNLPRPGKIKACVQFTHYLNLTSTTVSATFQIKETSNSSATTHLQDGGPSVSSYINADSEPVRIGNSHHVCGFFSFTTLGQKTIRLMHLIDITGTPTSNYLSGTDGSFDERNIYWDITPAL